MTKPIKTKPKDAKDKHLDAFFASLPLMPSHYNRENSQKKYLQSDLTYLAQLYAEYKRRETISGRIPFKITKFSEVFHTQNLALYIPLKDQCIICQSQEIEERQDYGSHRQELKHQKKYAEMIKG